MESIRAGVKAEPIKQHIFAKIGLQEVINYSFIDKSVKELTKNGR